MIALPAPPPEVAAVLAAAAPGRREGLERLRALILTSAAEMPEIGRVVEALRWGQPAFLTPDTGAASSLRIGEVPGGFALFVHCKTPLIADFLAGPGANLQTQGARAVVFRDADEVSEEPLTYLIKRALRYHLRPKAATPRP
jgi:hypothetical protein